MGWWLDGMELGLVHDFPVLTAPGVRDEALLAWAMCQGLRHCSTPWPLKVCWHHCTQSKQGKKLFKNKMPKPCICVQCWLVPQVSTSSHLSFSLLNYISTIDRSCPNRAPNKWEKEKGGNWAAWKWLWSFGQAALCRMPWVWDRLWLCYTCHMAVGQSQQLNKTVSGESCARNRAGWKGFGSMYEGAVAAARIYMPHSDFWSKVVS